MKNKHLVFFFIASAATFWGLRDCAFGSKRLGKGLLLAIDSARVDRFSFHFAGRDEADRSWQRVAQKWRMTASGRSFFIKNEAIAEFFASFEKAKILRVASRSRADQRLFSCDDSTAARLDFFEKTGRSLGSIWLGGASENEKNEAVSFARLPLEDAVFELAGQPVEWLSRHPNSFKINDLCRFDASNTTALTFADAGQKPLVIWRGEDGKWLEPMASRALADGQIERLFAALERAEKGLPEAEDFDEMKKSGAFFCSLLVSSTEPSATFSLQAWRPKGERDFIVRSSQRPDAFFRAPDSLARAIFARPIF